MAALLLVLLVATGEAETPATQTTVRVAREVLDGAATIVVREVAPEALTDAEATRIRSELHADSVVVLTWPDPLRRTALVHARVAREGEWTDRYVTFSVSDPVAERGRTLGFEIASMVPSRWSTRPRANAKPEAKLEPLTPEGTKLEPLTPVGAKLEPPTPSRSHMRPIRVTLETLGLAAAGSGAGGIGGDAAVRFWGLDGVLTGRVVVGARFGDVPDAAAISVIVRFGGGVALRVLRPTPEQRFGLGLRVDGLGLWQRVARADSSSIGARLVPGGDLMLEASWQAASTLAVLTNVGAEASFGDTTILVDERAAATIAPVRGVVEVGLRWEP